MIAAVLPAIQIKPDDEWVREIPFLRGLAGGLLALGVVIAVGALAVVGVRVAMSKAGWGRQVDPSDIVRVLLVALAIASLSGLVAFSFSKFSMPKFSSDYVPPLPTVWDLPVNDVGCRPPVVAPGCP